VAKAKAKAKVKAKAKPKLEREAVATMEELIDALAEARDEVRRTEQSLRRTLRRVDRGDSVASAVISSDPASLRESYDSALEVVAEARHRLRSLVFALALDEGLSIGDLGRAWGVSRQLASRYVKEVAGTRS